MPDDVGVPLIVISSAAHNALTPAGKPFAAATPSSTIPVAPPVACVIFNNEVFSHKVGVALPAPAVLLLSTVTITLSVELQPFPFVPVTV